MGPWKNTDPDQPKLPCIGMTETIALTVCQVIQQRVSRDMSSQLVR